jgi:hypothetical protein
MCEQNISNDLRKLTSFDCSFCQKRQIAIKQTHRRWFFTDKSSYYDIERCKFCRKNYTMTYNKISNDFIKWTTYEKQLLPHIQESQNEVSNGIMC